MPESTSPPADWAARVESAWGDFDAAEPAAFVERIDALAAELGDGSGPALAERGGARDSTGDPQAAEGFYRRALDAGLPGARRREVTIQLASTVRNLGRPEEALALLDAEAHRTSDELDPALAAFTALVLTDLGRDREATATALGALAPTLPRYQASVARYADALLPD